MLFKLRNVSKVAPIHLISTALNHIKTMLEVICTISIVGSIFVFILNKIVAWVNYGSS